jgi:hypothetical protein
MAIEVLKSTRFNGGSFDCSCAVDKHIDGANVVANLLQQFAKLFMLIEVCTQTHGTRAEHFRLDCDGLQILKLSANEAKRRALSCQSESNGLPDPAATAGDDRGSITKPLRSPFGQKTGSSIISFMARSPATTGPYRR